MCGPPNAICAFSLTLFCGIHSQRVYSRTPHGVEVSYLGSMDQKKPGNGGVIASTPASQQLGGLPSRWAHINPRGESAQLQLHHMLQKPVSDHSWPMTKVSFDWYCCISLGDYMPLHGMHAVEQSYAMKMQSRCTRSQLLKTYTENPSRWQVRR